MNGKRAIVCTDQDQHSRQRLGFVLEIGDRTPSSTGNRTEVLRDRDGNRTGFRIRCDKCGRAPEFRYDTWQRLVTGLDAADPAGEIDLDISSLPF